MKISMGFTKVKIICISFILVMFGCATASDDVSVYRQEAKAHCDVFAAENWEGVGSNLEPWELQALIRERIDAAVKSKEMRSILSSLLDVRPENRYTNYIEQVSKLTKEEHSCANLKNYFGP